MPKPILTILAFALCTAMGWCLDASHAEATSDQPVLLKTIMLNMGSEARAITDSRYKGFFKQADALAGVSAIIRAGQFSINGFTLPGTEATFRKDYPSGFLVNQVPWLVYDADKAAWKGGYKAEKAAATYEVAALATATGIVPGLEVSLYDTDGDGYADRIDADYKEGVAIGRIIRNSDDSFTVLRADPDNSPTTPYEGRVFDADHFTKTSGEIIKGRNFDPSLAPNDVALFWYGLDGWVLRRAKEVRGTFLGGADHQTYNIDGKVYQDAMRFSRDNIAISNRPGEYVNAHNYFGFDERSDGAKVSLWLVPATAAGTEGAPVALTSGESAGAFLDRAIARAEATLASAAVSEDGGNVPVDRKWVTPTAHAQLRDAIDRARAVLETRESAPPSLDYQTYLLYLTLNGSNGDIGARFGGFQYTGFVRGMKPGAKPLPRP